jgi:L,D-peptidoglycan transpeptidase YkuD (ErfK/YbiS/YcfS/YnhG family)
MRVLAAVLLLGIVPASVSAQRAPAVGPDGMRGLGSADRVIEISTNAMSTTHATARTYRLAGDRWRIVRRAMSARVGVNGLSWPKRRHAGDGTTPIGNYGFVYDFGSRRNPGVSGFRWRKLVPGSCWAGGRASYNRWVHRVPCGPTDENLWSSASVAYRYASVIDFNYDNPVYGRGSGIFLHEQTGRATAGCVSLKEGDLLAVLRWMRPGTRILIGPATWLRSLKR